jgi:hypothetical protein
MKEATRKVKILVSVAIFVPVVFFSSCAYISHKGNSAYEVTQAGDMQSAVIEKFDMPFVRKASGERFAKYAAEGCMKPCAERLWFENRMSLGIEAWTVDFDKRGLAIDKYHWVSP